MPVLSISLKTEFLLDSKGQKSKGRNPKIQILNPPPEAEACFLKAITIAQRQQAKLWELRAVMSLVRLRQQQISEQGTRTALTDAHRMLAEVYGWFTEGFNTKDLQEAEALLRR
jgi:hypothetical protein